MNSTLIKNATKLISLFWINSCTICFCIGQITIQGVEIMGHSHNDYEQKHPLETALQNQFSSIEIDIFEYNGQIVVCHDKEELESKPNIEELYFEPLFSKASLPENLILLIDIKELSPDILELLHQKIEPYANRLKSITDDESKDGIQIILSGDVPKAELLQSQKFQHFFIDGRATDLGQQDDYKRIAMISAKFTDLTTWRGKGKYTNSGIEDIIKLVREAKAQNLKIRFWDTLDNAEIWKILLGLRVDFIGVDNIKRFTKFAKMENVHRS